MNRTELNDLWKSQRKEIERWQESLVREAVKLYKSVSARLQPDPETWPDFGTGEQRKYVDLLDISEKPQQLRGGFTHKSFTDEGELFFAIQVTFDQGLRTYPKTQLHVPIAVRYKAGTPQFSFFDTQSKTVEPQAQWNADIGVFTEAVISRIEKYLRFDPFHGPRSPSSIGFL